MIDFKDLPIPLLMAYAETHFRFFPFFPSILFKREPEIVFDIPRRLNPGKSLPILLIANDIHRFPVTFVEAAVAISQKSDLPKLFKFKNLQEYELAHSFQEQMRVFIFTIPPEELPDGDLLINATVSIKKGRSIKVIFNDNLFSSSKHPFPCRKSSKELPGNDLCMYGDLHNHSMYSQSHVEYGPPLETFDLIADVSGLTFLAITDHSYDLACKKEDYLVQDQSLKKWKTFKSEFKKQFKTIMIQGEEISCLNSNGNVVHLCGIGIDDFIPGTLDGGRKDLKFFPQLTISQAVNAVHSQGGLTYAAHPGAHTGILQTLFLHRGTWSEDDLENGIDGVQALNSGFKSSWEKGKSLWIKMLQKGYRVPLLAGNDAHGDFNRYRAILMPFFRIYEESQRFMGYGKTGIYGKQSSAEGVFEGIKNSATFVSTGPYVSINYTSSPQSYAISTKNMDSSVQELYIHAVSTSEFGHLNKISLIAGKPGAQHEDTIFVKHYTEDTYEVNQIIPLKLDGISYLRAEVVSKNDTDTFKAFTSACWTGNCPSTGSG